MAGKNAAMALSYKVARLSGLLEAVMAFKNEIFYKTAPLYEAIYAASKRDISGVFEKSLEHIFEKGGRVAFEKALENCELDREEKEIMLSFAAGLLAPCKEGQIKNAEHTIEKISHLLIKATEKKEKYFSLYCTIGLLGGAAGGIVFF